MWGRRCLKSVLPALACFKACQRARAVTRCIGDIQHSARVVHARLCVVVGSWIIGFISFGAGAGGDDCAEQFATVVSDSLVPVDCSRASCIVVPLDSTARTELQIFWGKGPRE